MQAQVVVAPDDQLPGTYLEIRRAAVEQVDEGHRAELKQNLPETLDSAGSSAEAQVAEAKDRLRWLSEWLADLIATQEADAEDR